MIKSRTSKLKDVPQNQQLAQQQKGKKKSLAIMKDGLMLSALRFFIYFILFYFIFLWVCYFPLKPVVLQKDLGFVEKNYG